jgi:uncharacterized protein
VPSSKAASAPAQNPASLLGSDTDEQADAELTPALGRVLSMLEAYCEPPVGPGAQESLSVSTTRGANAGPGGNRANGADDFAAQYLKLARSLWVDFCAQRQPRVQKPAVYAAAVEYTLSKLASRSLTQAQLARRYGVTARAIAARYEEIREALALEPGDPRYVGSSAK